MTAETPPDLLTTYADWLAFRQWYLRIPGVQAAVARDGEVLLRTALGVADISTDEPLRDDHLFRVASHSKSFTAVAVLQMVEQGQLRLDDPVAVHVPALKGTAVGATQLRELLAHSAGVVRDSEDGDFWQLMRPYPDQDELLRIAAAADAAVIPRNERFKYSNISYGLLGLVIEAVTGSGYAEHLRTSVIEPLGLTGTAAELADDDHAASATGHTALATSTTRATIPHVTTAALASATGFRSTATDLVTFFGALLPGDERLLGGEASRQLRHAQWEVRAGSRYGLGLFLTTVGEHELYGHSGGYPGFITITMACPDRRLVVSVLTNAIDGAAEPLGTALYRLHDLMESADHAPAAAPSRFTGRFASLWGVQDVVSLDGRLFVLSPAGADPAEEPLRCEVVDDDTLRVVDGPGGASVGELMRYERAADGSVVSLRGGSGMTLRPVVATPDGPPPVTS